MEPGQRKSFLSQIKRLKKEIWCVEWWEDARDLTEPKVASGDDSPLSDSLMASVLYTVFAPWHAGLDELNDPACIFAL